MRPIVDTGAPRGARAFSRGSNIKTRLICGLVLALAGCLPVAAVVSQDEAATVFGEATKDSVANTATVAVNVQSQEGVAGYQFVISFDPSVLAYKGVSDAGFLGTTDREVLCSDPTVEPGAVRFACATLGSTLPSATGEGTLARMEFDVKAPGETTYTMSRVKLVRADGSSIPLVVAEASFGDDAGGDDSGVFEFTAARLILAIVALVVLAALAGGALLFFRRSSRSASPDAL
jgi:hypothetical protein